MTIQNKTYTFSVDTKILSSEVNKNFDDIYNNVNGNLDNSNIKDGAGIVDTKLNQISSADKVAITALPAAITGYLVPSGGIIMWSGTIATIPTGWYLCDGNNSTPNLTNRFIVCADADDGGVAKSTITGSALQSHDTGVIPAHTHTLNTRWNDDVGATYGNVRSVSGAAEGTATSSSVGTSTKVISVFYALAYIMKS